MSATKIRCMAFSLVEVAMALGIFSMGIIPLVGLLASGLTTNRANLDRSTQSQIFNWVQADVRSQTTAYSAQFDEFGISTAVANAPYRANMTPKPIVLPGGALSLPAWEVAITQQSRGNQQLAKKIVWGSQ